MSYLFCNYHLWERLFDSPTGVLCAPPYFTYPLSLAETCLATDRRYGEFGNGGYGFYCMDTTHKEAIGRMALKFNI